ncbi:MAG: peptidase M14 [Cyclobacteriaceae bacterium]|nr:peptidase M14 [Cyclobacteriaceae bacterium]
MKIIKIAFLSGMLVYCHFFAFAQYKTTDQIIRELQQLQGRHTSLAEFRIIGKSYGGIDLPVILLGENPAEVKPAILLVAGIDGRHISGTQLALKIAAETLNNPDDSIRQALLNHHLYIIPFINPDALSSYFGEMRFERRGNARPTDHDRDGRVDEDPFEDLNRDGLITLMRIADPSGTHIPHPEDERILIQADPSKGEKGKYLVYTEGIDNDKDGRFNEDGLGGVWIDKNFSFDYPAFSEGAGEMAVSEPESRALLDFIYQHPNIHTIITLGPSNNLTKVAAYDEKQATARIMTSPAKADVVAAEWVSALFNRSMATNEAPELPLQRGDFVQTAYFHMGRFSYASQGWWPPEVNLPKDTTQTNEEKVKSDERAKNELNFLRWADREGIDVFVPWQSIQHPDFPGKTVEVGGIRPFAMLNPPVVYLDTVSQYYKKFIRDLLWASPKVELVDATVEQIDKQLFRITVKVINSGLLPTGTGSGDKLRYMPNLKTEIVLTEKQTLLSGKKHYLRGALAPGESVEYSWLIQGSGAVSLSTGSPAAGKATYQTQLK